MRNRMLVPSKQALVLGAKALVPGKQALVPGKQALVPEKQAAAPGRPAPVESVPQLPIDGKLLAVASAPNCIAACTLETWKRVAWERHQICLPCR